MLTSQQGTHLLAPIKTSAVKASPVKSAIVETNRRSPVVGVRIIGVVGTVVIRRRIGSATRSGTGSKTAGRTLRRTLHAGALSIQSPGVNERLGSPFGGEGDGLGKLESQLRLRVNHGGPAASYQHTHQAGHKSGSCADGGSGAPISGSANRRAHASGGDHGGGITSIGSGAGDAGECGFNRNLLAVCECQRIQRNLQLRSPFHASCFAGVNHFSAQDFTTPRNHQSIRHDGPCQACGEGVTRFVFVRRKELINSHGYECSCGNRNLRGNRERSGCWIHLRRRALRRCGLRGRRRESMPSGRGRLRRRRLVRGRRTGRLICRRRGILRIVRRLRVLLVRSGLVLRIVR